MKRPEFIARQSSKPSGVVGVIVASVMQGETAEDNQAAITLLKVRAGETLIDVGTGNGWSLTRLAALTGTGITVGIDHSPLMCARARRLNRSLIRQGKVRVETAPSGSLPFPDAYFDAGMSVHTVYFWDDLPKQFREIARVLRAGGRFLLGFRTSSDAGAANFPSSIYHFYSELEIAEAAQAARFRIQDVNHRPTASGEIVFMSVVKC